MIPIDTAVAEALADDGPLARTLEGFEPRPGQRRMAAAVSRTFEDGGILLAEAGTGTGKTLAYLLPAILHRHRVLISTGTKNLQEQIVQKDVPLLQQAVDVPFTATCMKGRSNYLCLHRFDDVRATPGTRSPEAQRHLTLLAEWVESTDTGDRADIADLPEDFPLWNEISASAENCLGRECPQYDRCFVTRMRDRAAASDLVIVNHHLLCADAALRQHSFGEVIPPCNFAVIDEAHQLEEVATQYFGVTLSNFQVDQLVRDGLRAAKPMTPGEAGSLEALRRALARLEFRARSFFLDIARRPIPPDAGLAADGSPFDERRRLTPAMTEAAADSALAVTSAFEEAEAAVNLIAGASEDLAAIARRAVELRDVLRFVLLASDPAYVYFLETRGRGVFLRAMPIDVSSIMRDVLFDRMQATVLTSATLAVNGRFDYVRQRLGIDDATEIRLPSEFDYRHQSILYLPRQMPDPRAAEFARRATAEIASLLRCTRGRAFVLFTSYAMLRQVEADLVGEVPYPILVQGDASRSRLLEQFKETPNAVLLATSSFWQGVDVVGEALSCVIIDKLPFASPGDPVVQARIEAITSQGGDAFSDYQVPLAVLTLLQGLGRLLRHRGDRGVLAVLDPRLRTMGYGRRFLASMPPSPITHDINDVARFFETPAPQSPGSSS